MQTKLFLDKADLEPDEWVVRVLLHRIEVLPKSLIVASGELVLLCLLYITEQSVRDGQTAPGCPGRFFNQLRQRENEGADLARGTLYRILEFRLCARD